MKKIKYIDGYKHQLYETYSVPLDFNPAVSYDGQYLSLNLNGLLTIKKGYCWDGASGPTWDTKNCKRASLVHDALYQLMREKVIPRSYRIHADDLFYKHLREDGMWYIRARLWYRSVRVAAFSSADPKNRKKVITAP